MSDLALLIPEALIERIVERVLAELQSRGAATESRAPSPYLNVVEAAERLRSGRQRVYDLLSAGRLTRYKDGTRTLVSRAEIDAYLAGTDLRAVAPVLPHPTQARIKRGFAA